MTIRLRHCRRGDRISVCADGHRRPLRPGPTVDHGSGLAFALTACHPKPAERSSAPAEARLAPGETLLDNRAAAFVAMARDMPDFGKTPSAFHKDDLDDCGVIASPQLSILLCGEDGGIDNLLIGDRKPGINLAPPVQAVVELPPQRRPSKPWPARPTRPAQP